MVKNSAPVDILRIKSAMGTKRKSLWISMDKINGYFNYMLINGYKCKFNGIRTRGYPYLLLNRVNYINNFNTFHLPKQKTSVL